MILTRADKLLSVHIHMVNIGKLNKLKVVKNVDFGLYLDGGDFGEILVPKRYLLQEYNPDDIIEVFIYYDSEDRIIATTQIPYAVTGQFADLNVVEVNATGAFLDWGLQKDLLVPFNEQKVKMKKGNSYLVYVYLDDDTQRIIASSHLEKFIDNEQASFKEGEKVELILYEETDIGYSAIINNAFQGIIYKNEVFQKLKKGKATTGFIKKIRDDKKIDLTLYKPGYGKIKELSDPIIEILQKMGGFLPVTDKSSPETIYKLFGMSKKNYKKSIGALYKKKLITIEDTGIRLNTGAVKPVKASNRN